MKGEARTQANRRLTITRRIPAAEPTYGWLAQSKSHGWASPGVTRMRLSEILSPVTLSDFRNLYYQTKAFYVAGAETKLSSIFDWSALSELLNTLELPNPNLRLVKEGRRIGYDDHRSLLNACRDGATLILDGLHKYNKEACWLAQEISGAISEPSQINLYLSQPGMGGFNVHYDTHDVLILQLSGKKNWEVFPSTINQPLFYQKEHGKEAPTEPYLVETR